MNRYYFGSEQLVIEATTEAEARQKLKDLLEKGEIEFIVDDVDKDCI
jgi:DNA-dependent RNA polymerase auxiliary subunit epsilon